jgi:hypothetical protein
MDGASYSDQSASRLWMEDQSTSRPLVLPSGLSSGHLARGSDASTFIRASLAAHLTPAVASTSLVLLPSRVASKTNLKIR